VIFAIHPIIVFTTVKIAANFVNYKKKEYAFIKKNSCHQEVGQHFIPGVPLIR